MRWKNANVIDDSKLVLNTCKNYVIFLQWIIKKKDDKKSRRC